MKISGIFLLFFLLNGCSNLTYDSKNNYSSIENQIKKGDIVIKDNKIFYKEEFDIFMNGENEIELLKEYAKDNGLIVAPID